MPISLQEQHEAVERMRWVLLGREPAPKGMDERHALSNALEEAVETIRAAELTAIRGRDLLADRERQVQA